MVSLNFGAGEETRYSSHPKHTTCIQKPSGYYYRATLIFMVVWEEACENSIQFVRNLLIIIFFNLVLWYLKLGDKYEL